MAKTKTLAKRELPAVSARQQTRIVTRLAAVMFVALALYSPTLMFDFTYLDDAALISDVQSFGSGSSSVWRSFSRQYFQAADRDHDYYRPLVNASLALDAKWGSLRPFAYHATNVAIHALAAGLLFLLLRRLGQADNLALFGGLLFAVHPALTEAVAWLPGRNDSLLAVFALASWLLFLRSNEPFRYLSRSDRQAVQTNARDAGVSVDNGRFGSTGRKRVALTLHCLLFLCALLTKEAASVLPLLFAGHLLFVGRRPWRSLLTPVLGWVAVAGVYLTARAAVVSNHLGVAGTSAASLYSNFSLFVIGLGKLVLPVNLSVLAIPEDTRLWPGLLAAILVLCALRMPGIRRREALVALSFFVVLVWPSLPASNLLNLENRFYLPAVGIVWLICEFAKALRWPTRRKIVGAGTILALFATVSFSYSREFRDRLTFSLAAVRGSPHSSLAHRNLGVTYHVAGDRAAARREYDLALAQDRSEPVAHNNLGVLLMSEGRLAEAEQQLRQELAINARYVPAIRNLALVLQALGRREEAAQQWESLVRIDGKNHEALRELSAYYRPRDAAKAEKYLSELPARDSE